MCWHTILNGGGDIKLKQKQTFPGGGQVGKTEKKEMALVLSF